MGEELYPIQTVYLAGDEEDKRNVERILRIVYSNVITGIHPPPSNLSAGKYPLGMVLSGDKTLHPFFLRDEDWFHVGIFGQTGRGKTNAMLHLLQILKKHHIPWLVFDWKRTGYRDLVSKYETNPANQKISVDWRMGIGYNSSRVSPKPADDHASALTTLV